MGHLPASFETSGARVSSDKARDPSKKHRHDIGEVDHGPDSTEPTTRTIQVILGICIALSAVLTMYALAHAVGIAA